MSNPTKKWERNCESPIGRCFWCKFRPKCENDDQEDNFFLFWDVLGEDGDCVNCADCEKGDCDENKIHPPGEWRHFEFSASAASSFVFNIKFFTTVFIIIVVVSTTSCSWLPNQMISLISMFGFLCRSIPIPKSQMIEKNRMYSNVLGGVTTNNKQSHRSDSIPFETRYFYSHIASVVIFCRHIMPFSCNIIFSFPPCQQIKINIACFTSPILPGRWAEQDGSTWSDACHHTKRSGHQKKKVINAEEAICTAECVLPCPEL